jgi:hypothetical protein
MKAANLSVLILLLFACRLNAQKNYSVDFDYNGMSFKEFISAVESRSLIRFFYKDEWVDSLKLSGDKRITSLGDILDHLLKGTSIYFSEDKAGNIVFTKGFRITTNPGEKDNPEWMPSEYKANDQESREKGNSFVEIGNPVERNMPGRATISGYIINTDTKEPIAGATIIEKSLSVGTISNEFGFFTLMMPRGIRILNFSFVGMKEMIVNLNVFGSGELKVEMKSILIPLKEAVISARKNITLRRFETGAERINFTSFKLLPSSIGESDIIKSILMIPGVQSVGEGSAGFNVRGGSADQNLILLYGAPVYNSSHFFGFFSAVNPDVIKDVTLYKGGIPSRYGGRISSVLDIETTEGSKEKFKGSAGLSPVTTHLSLEGPLIKDTLTYVLSARTTYSDWIFDLMRDKSLRRSKALFYDLNGKIVFNPDTRNKFDFSSYLSHDSFRFNSDSVYNYNNRISALKWQHNYTSRFFSVLSLNNSLYNYTIFSNESRPEDFELSHKLNSTGFKADFNWFKNRNEINFGFDLNRYSINPGNYKPPSDSSLVIPRYIPKEKAWETAFYLEEKYPVSSFLSVSAGIRLSYYFVPGPSEILVYSPGFTKNRSSITDTLVFKAGQIAVGYPGPEFRLSLNFRLTEENSLKINYNRTRQYLHLLTNTTSISPTDTWKLSDYDIKPQTGDQIAMGFYQFMLKNKIEVSAELYYKKIRNMADFKGGANLIMNEYIQEDIINAEGKAYGLELILKKAEGKFRYTIGYTYSRTFIRSVSNLREEIINSGRWFPANYDKPNDLSITSHYLVSRRFSLSGNFAWSTGRPITYPVGTYYMYNKLLVDYSERNKYRLPDYSRLDLSFTVHGNLRANKLINPNWTFSVYNVLGRRNVYSVFFRKEDGKIKGYEFSVFAMAVPSLTINFDF